MDEFFQYNLDVEDYMPWINQSAFVNYEYKPIVGGISNNGPNIHKRMMAMLTGKRQIPVTGVELSERERHMISERIRRRKQKQFFLNLHSLLPPQTKSDRRSIVQMAVQKIEELERVKLDLERKNRAIEIEQISKTEFEEETAVKIEFTISRPSSGIDSVLEVLKCLKESRSKLKAMNSRISPHELSTVLEVQNRVKQAAAVEMAVQRTIIEVERKFHPLKNEMLDESKGR